MRFFNQKGLTLIEVLVSILILASGSVYILQALAKSAEVQKRVEDGVMLYPFLASKLAQIEMRVSSEKNPLALAQGSYVEDKRTYKWTISSAFRNPLEAKAPRESLGESLLLERAVSVGLENKKSEERLLLSTLTRAPILENQK